MRNARQAIEGWTFASLGQLEAELLENTRERQEHLALGQLLPKTATGSWFE